MALGEILRNARVQKGLSVSDVAETTRMMVQVVESLEREDFRRIAAPIYGRGFIKLYAELLELDPDPLVRDFMELYDGARVPAVRTKKVEPTPDPVPVTRTVLPAGADSVEPPQRQPVQPRPAIRTLTGASEPSMSVSGTAGVVSTVRVTATAVKPLLVKPAKPAAPVSDGAAAPSTVFPADDIQKQETSRPLVVEPEEPYTESDEPDLFHPNLTPRPTEDADTKTSEAVSPKRLFSASKPKYPIFKIGGRLEAPLGSEPSAESRLRHCACIRSFADGVAKLRTGIQQRMPDMLSRKQFVIIGAAGVVLAVFMAVGIGVLFKMTGTNVHQTPAVIIERIAPPPALYVD